MGNCWTKLRLLKMLTYLWNIVNLKTWSKLPLTSGKDLIKLGTPQTRSHIIKIWKMNRDTTWLLLASGRHTSFQVNLKLWLTPETTRQQPNSDIEKKNRMVKVRCSRNWRKLWKLKVALGLTKQSSLLARCLMWWRVILLCNVGFILWLDKLRRRAYKINKVI